MWDKIFHKYSHMEIEYGQISWNITRVSYENKQTNSYGPTTTSDHFPLLHMLLQGAHLSKGRK